MNPAYGWFRIFDGHARQVGKWLAYMECYRARDIFCGNAGGGVQLCVVDDFGDLVPVTA